LQASYGSNRTIVGLKLKSLGAELLAAIAQQSHHCGIETNRIDEVLRQLLQQQSHHCGIETPTTVVGIRKTSGSNRTIVGLKR